MDGVFITLIGKWSYLGLLLVLLAAGLGLPIPEDIPLIASGYICYKGQADIYTMVAVGLAGVMLGDSVLFLMGRRYGIHIVEHKWLSRIAKPWLLEEARRKFANHGAKIIFAARFMPGLRAVLFLTAGVFRVPYWKFLLIDGSAALFSVPMWIVGAWYFGGHFEAFLGGARTATIIIGIVLAVLFVGWIFYEYRRHLRDKRRKAESKGVVGATVSAPLHDTGRSERTAIRGEKLVAGSRE